MRKYSERIQTSKRRPESFQDGEQYSFALTVSLSVLAEAYNDKW